MRYLDVQRSTQNRVMAVFKDSAFCFDIAPAATLEDLVARLAHLRGRRDGALISVAVMVCPAMTAGAANGEWRGRKPEGDRR